MRIERSDDHLRMIHVHLALLLFPVHLLRLSLIFSRLSFLSYILIISTRLSFRIQKRIRQNQLLIRHVFLSIPISWFYKTLLLKFLMKRCQLLKKTRLKLNILFPRIEILQRFKQIPLISIIFMKNHTLSWDTMPKYKTAYFHSDNNVLKQSHIVFSPPQ